MGGFKVCLFRASGETCVRAGLALLGVAHLWAVGAGGPGCRRGCLRGSRLARLLGGGVIVLVAVALTQLVKTEVLDLVAGAA